jgi:hypothetical protein
MRHRDRMASLFPAMLRHEGLWAGTYTHLDITGSLIDRHGSEVHCLFPQDGPHPYVQKNRFFWEDGREEKATLEAWLAEDGRLRWDNDRFHGCAWETDFGVVMLRLDRKDEPGAHFVECIVLGESGHDRVRTWHWFKDGRPIRRTLCDERRIG